MDKKRTSKGRSFSRNAAKAVLFLFRYWWLAALAALAVALAVVVRTCSSDPPSLAFEKRKAIDVTPEEIRAIRDIGQWEFLSVSTEELAEIHEQGIFSDRQLVRIYQGTLRIGIDLKNAPDDWFTARGDTAVLKLPDVGLLDKDFIDEARSRPFYEKGHMDAGARQRLHEQARQAMLRRHLTPQNLKTARENAREQFGRIFQSFGFKAVEISFMPQSGKQKR